MGGSSTFWASKRLFDVGVSLLLLVPMIVLGVALLIVNPFLNPGPLFYRQVRMGQDCRAFWAIKFRSMRPAERISRSVEDPVEIDRIMPLGHVLRRSRLDELPQVLNVLAGQMSLIGPRPDYFSHAKVFARSVPGYRERHRVRPGISGYAQVELGYAEGVDATRAKAAADLYYIRNASFALDTRLLFKTIRVVLGRKGA
ncbi:sugar transferase [Tropicimonas sp. IMCC34011]|uniref:sugar transferase n=1 Tax=Tropicimonas sp. IMCC34011 TaxID=2248759 RepID=UPI001E4D04C3|nr:sugar transferase [Tropicimonas sp. IMCC34011]